MNYKEIRLRNNSTEVLLSPERGGLVTSFKINGKEILYLNKKLFEDKKNQKPRMGIPILAPYVGRFKDSCIQHGGVREASWALKAKGNDFAKISLKFPELPDTIANELKRVYGDDFNFVINLKISVIEKGIIFEINLKNLSSTKKPFALGLHPYFRLNIVDRDKIVSNIRDFDTLKMNEKNALYFKTDNKELVWFNFPDKGINFRVSPEFKYFGVWGEDEKDNICFEPLTSYGNKEKDYIFIKPKEKKELRVEIGVS